MIILVFYSLEINRWSEMLKKQDSIVIGQSLMFFELRKLGFLNEIKFVSFKVLIYSLWIYYKWIDEGVSKEIN